MSDLDTPDEGEVFKSQTDEAPTVTASAADFPPEPSLGEESFATETLDDLPTAPEDANVSLGEITLTPLAAEEGVVAEEDPPVTAAEDNPGDEDGGERPVSRGMMAESDDPMLSACAVNSEEVNEEGEEEQHVVTSITDSVEVEENGAGFSLANVKTEPIEVVDEEEAIPEERLASEAGDVALKEEPLSDGPRDIEVPCHDDGQLKGNYTSGGEAVQVEAKKEKKKKYSKKKKDKKKPPVINLFGRRTLQLRSLNMEIHPGCMLPNGKVNLKELKRRNPAVFVVPESNVYFGDWTPERDLKKKKAGRPPKVKEEPKDKKKRGRAKIKEEVLSDSDAGKKKRRKSSGSSVSTTAASSSKKVKSQAILDSSSDSELEMMRKKHLKTTSLTSTTTSAPKKVETKQIIESDSDDGEKERRKKKKEKESSAMTELKKLITEKEKEKSAEKPPEKVKEVLVEKLFNLISGEEKEKSEKKKDELESPQSPSNDGGQDIDSAVTSEAPEVKKSEKSEPSKREETKVPSSSSSSSSKRSCEKGPINLRFFESTYDLRRFKKTVLMELRDDADFLSKRHQGITIKEFERRLVEAVTRIDKNVPVCLSRPPPVERDSKEVRDLKRKYKIRKEPVLKIRDVKFSSRYRKRYSKALPYLESGLKRKTRQRKEGLLQGLKVVKKLIDDYSNHGSAFKNLKEKRKAILSDSDSDNERDRHKQHKKSHRDRDQDDDPTKIGGFKIPRKDKKEAKPLDSKSGMKSILKSEEKKKSDVKTHSYNHSYGAGNKKEPHKRIRGLETNAQNKQISFDAFQVDEKDNFNVLSVVNSMKTIEKDKEKRKKDLMVDPKLRDAQNKLGELKAKRPNAPPGGASATAATATDAAATSQASNEASEPVIETFDDCPAVGGDEELEEILSRRVQDVSGRIFNTISARVEEDLIVFKCWVCDARIDGKSNLITHLAGFRHHGSSKKFKEVAPAPIQTRPQAPPKKVQEKAPQMSNSGEVSTWGPGGPKIIPKHRKRDQFQPNEQKRRGPHPFDHPSSSRPRSPMDDGHDDGGYSPYGGGGDDYANNSPSPPPPSGFGNPWETSRSPRRELSATSTAMPSLFLPKPVSSLPRAMPSLPKPVPAMTLRQREEEEEAERRRRMEMLRFETGGQETGFGSFSDSFSGPPSRPPAPFGDPFDNDRLRGGRDSFGRFEDDRRRGFEDRERPAPRFSSSFGRFDAPAPSRAPPAKDPDDDYFDMRPYEERMRDRAKRMKELEDRERMIRIEEERLQAAIQAQRSGMRPREASPPPPQGRERGVTPPWNRELRGDRPFSPPGPVPAPGAPIEANSGFDQPPMPVPVPAPAPMSSLTKASLSVADLERLPKPLTMAEKVAAHLETQNSENSEPLVSNDWQRAREARMMAMNSQNEEGSGSNTPIGNRSAVSEENKTDEERDSVGNDFNDAGGVSPIGRENDEADRGSDAGKEDAYIPGGATPLWEPTQAEKSIKVPKGKGFSDFNIDPTKSFLDSGFSAEAAALALREKEEKKRKKKEEEEERKKNSEKPSSSSRAGGLQIKSLTKLMANPEEAVKSDAIKQNFNSFLDQVIKTLSKDKQPGGAAPAKRQANSLQLPSLDQEEDDTPPMPPSDDDNPWPPPPPSNPPPMPSTSSLSGSRPLQPPPPPPEPDADPQHTALLSDPIVLRIASEVDPNLTEHERMIRARERISQYLLAKGGSAMPHAPRAQQPIHPPPQHAGFPNPMGNSWGGPQHPPHPPQHQPPQPQMGGFFGPQGGGFIQGQSANNGSFGGMLSNRPPPPPPTEPHPNQIGSRKPRGNVTDNDINDFMNRWGVGDSSADHNVRQESREREPEEPKQFSSALAKLRAKKAAKKRQEEMMREQQNNIGSNRQSQGEDRMSECSMASGGHHEETGENERKRKVTSDETREKLKRMRMELEGDDGGGENGGGGGDEENPPFSLQTPAVPDLRAAAEAANSQRSQLTIAKEIANKVHQDLEHEPSISEFLGGYYEKQNELRNNEGDGDDE